MNNRVEMLLGRWGQWKLQHEGQPLAASADPGALLQRRQAGVRDEPVIALADPEILRVDMHIDALHPDMVAVLKAHYTWPGPVKIKLDRLHLSRTLYYNYLEFAHKQIRHWLGAAYAD